MRYLQEPDQAFQALTDLRPDASRHKHGCSYVQRLLTSPKQICTSPHTAFSAEDFAPAGCTSGDAALDRAAEFQQRGAEPDLLPLPDHFGDDL